LIFKSNSNRVSTMNLLDGKKVREVHKVQLIEYIKNSKDLPTLAIIQVGDDPSSSLYIEQKKKFGQSIGVRVLHTKLPGGVSFEDLQKIIQTLNADKKIHGIIVQLPLPKDLDPQKVIDSISPNKDVDGLTSSNIEKLEKGFVPATARGILTLLREYGLEVKGKKVTIIGRSKLVGAPTARLMEREGARVTVCHRQTVDIPSETRSADIIIVAAGYPNLLTKDYVKEGQVVVDVGINTLSGQSLNEEIPSKKVVGDVDFEAVSKIVEYLSPVPGGVGPMTVLSLFENLIDAHKMCNN